MTQTTAQPYPAPVIAVRGEVSREVPPELVQISVSVTARDKDRQATLSRLTERQAALGALLDGYAAAIEKRETSAVYVRPETRRSGERVVAYTGTVTTGVTLHDFTVLGELVLRLADQDQVSVGGPYWSLRPTSEVHRQARRAAVDDALARAREYADAVGATLLRLLELSDVGMSGPQPIRPMMFAAGAVARGAGGGAPELDLDPQPQTVQAQIEARFVVSEPALPGVAGA